MSFHWLRYFFSTERLKYMNSDDGSSKSRREWKIRQGHVLNLDKPVLMLSQRNELMPLILLCYSFPEG